MRIGLSLLTGALAAFAAAAPAAACAFHMGGFSPWGDPGDRMLIWEAQAARAEAMERAREAFLAGRFARAAELDQAQASAPAATGQPAQPPAAPAPTAAPAP